MSELEAIGLGIVQGLTEFLPVSSSGHLVLFNTLLGQEGEGGLVFEVALHVATLGAILLFYRKRISTLIRGALAGAPDAWRYTGKLALGTLPIAVLGLSAKDLVEQVFAVPWVTGVCLLVTGAVVWSTRTHLESSKGSEPSWRGALVIGFAQALALLPGISRSGSTVAAALALGVAPAAAAEFSFLLGVIAISGAAVLMLPGLASASPDFLGSLMLGSVSALLSGVVALWIFVRMLRTHAFYRFAYYAWAVGSGFLIWLMLR